MSKYYSEEQVNILCQALAEIYQCDENDIAIHALSHFDKLTPIQLPTDKTTRFEVIDGAGRRLVEYGVNIEVSMQDDGRTMKVFLTKIK